MTKNLIFGLDLGPFDPILTSHIFVIKLVVKGTCNLKESQWSKFEKKAKSLISGQILDRFANIFFVGFYLY